jgi:hypothetical protein
MPIVQTARPDGSLRRERLLTSRAILRTPTYEGEELAMDDELMDAAEEAAGDAVDEAVVAEALHEDAVEKAEAAVELEAAAEELAAEAVVEEAIAEDLADTAVADAEAASLLAEAAEDE